MNADTLQTPTSLRGRATDAYGGTRKPDVMIQRSQPRQVRFKIDGISCAGDAARLEHRLSRQVGVIGVCVNPINDHAYIAYDPAATSSSMLLRQIEFSGYLARER